MGAFKLLKQRKHVHYCEVIHTHTYTFTVYLSENCSVRDNDSSVSKSTVQPTVWKQKEKGKKNRENERGDIKYFHLLSDYDTIKVEG